MGWLIVNKEKYYAMKKELAEMKDDSPEGVVARAMNIMRLAGKAAETDTDYQDMIKKLYLAQIGKLDPTMSAYSKTTFMKDNSEEIIDRLREMSQGMLSKNKQLEDKRSKKK